MNKKISTLSVFSVVTAAVFFVSCSKKNDQTTEEKIVGKWTMEAAIGAYGLDDEINRDTTYFDDGEYLQFNSDGTLKGQEGETAVNGHWEIDNDKLVISETGYMDYPGGFTITEISGNKLELFYSTSQGPGSLEQKLKLKR